MSDSCSSGGCSGCPSASSCGVSEEFESLLVDQNQFSDIKKVIGVISGKGGVGKSLITSMLASPTLNIKKLLLQKYSFFITFN